MPAALETTELEKVMCTLVEEGDGLDLYHFAAEEDIDWDAEENATLALLYESEAIAF